MVKITVMISSTHDHSWFERNDGIHSNTINSINVVTNAVDAVELYWYTSPLLVKNSANKPIAPSTYTDARINRKYKNKTKHIPYKNNDLSIVVVVVVVLTLGIVKKIFLFN